MAVDKEAENSKYKLLGFEAGKSLAVFMVVSTGRVLKVKLAEVLNSEIIDNLALTIVECNAVDFIVKS
ncbi:hypothetical protein D3C85_1372870 [compost metagenome]